VVTRNVPDYRFVSGVPGRSRGWVSRHGHPLRQAIDNVYTCPESGLRYQENPVGVFRCLDLDEEAPLPDSLAIGHEPYRNFHPRD